MTTSRFVGIFVCLFLVLSSLLTIVNGARDPLCGPPHVVENRNHTNHKSESRKLINLNNCMLRKCDDGFDCWCCMQWPGSIADCFDTQDQCQHCCVPP